MSDLPPYYNMTSHQRAVMEAIVKSIHEKGESPTLQELAEATGREFQNVHKTVKRLEELGFISRKKNALRGITLMEAKT